jgi:hypothetical protein
MDENARMELAIVNQAGADPIPAFVGTLPADLREQMAKAVKAWMLRTPPIPARRIRATSISSWPMPVSKPVLGRN